MTQREWIWGYGSEATVDDDGSIAWTNHDHKASSRQTGRSFLVDGPADVYPTNTVPGNIVGEIRRAVQSLLNQSASES